LRKERGEEGRGTHVITALQEDMFGKERRGWVLRSRGERERRDTEREFSEMLATSIFFFLETRF